jgi:hypothetical protein
MTNQFCAVWAKDQEQLAKEVRVVAKPFHATRLSDGLAVEFVPGDVVTNLSNPDEAPPRFEFDSARGRCTISYDEVFRQTGGTVPARGYNGAVPDSS